MARPLAITLVSLGFAGLASGIWVTVAYQKNIHAEALEGHAAALETLAVEVGDLRRQNTALSGQMDRLRKELGKTGRRPDHGQPPPGAADQLARRIAKLETAHAEQYSSNTVDSVAQPIGDAIISRLNTQAAAGKSRPNERAEALFQSDYGAADEYTSDLIADAFNIADDDLGIQNIQCKSTICKVRYNSANVQAHSLGQHPVADAVLSQLMEDLGTETIAAHHARDAQGNNLMYIEIR